MRPATSWFWPLHTWAVRAAVIALALVASALTSACDDAPDEATWEVVASEEPGALLSVWGASANDVWVVGADQRDGQGPTVLHIVDGEVVRVPTGESSGDLWWVHGFVDGPIFMGGADGLILRYEDGAFTKLSTPGTGTVFGLWGANPDAMWAVGGNSDSNGAFAWRLEGDTWAPEPSLPASASETGALWKIHGLSEDNAVLVGSNGLSYSWDGQALRAEETGVGSSLFTVVGAQERYVAVGGLVAGIIVEYENGSWRDVTPSPVPNGLSGVAFDSRDGGGTVAFAVGLYGEVWVRSGSGWNREDTGYLLGENFHGVWVDPEGGAWVVGGNTFGTSPDSGVLLYREPPK